jgi:uncharacterized protein with ParB-like and HNH nuclease domain
VDTQYLEIYYQEEVDEKGNQKYDIIDGQQRIRAVLDYVHNKFSINESESDNGVAVH